MKRFALTLLLLTSAAALQAATITYHVSVDSSGIGSSTPGYIDFQFNQANASTSLAASATVDNFISSGFIFVDSGNLYLGGATGSLSAPPLIFDNTVAGNNVFDQSVDAFGTAFSFDVTFAGDALNTTAPDGSGFFVSLLGTDFSPLVLGDGLVASIVINGDTTITTNPTDLSTIEASTVPEPSSLLMIFAGVALVAFARRSNGADRRK